MTILICTHPELVCLGFKLGRRRNEAIEAAADLAIEALAAEGLHAEKSRSFQDWYGGKFHGWARVHNYVALPHHELTPSVQEAVERAAKLYVQTIASYQQRTP